MPAPSCGRIRAGHSQNTGRKCCPGPWHWWRNHSLPPSRPTDGYHPHVCSPLSAVSWDRSRVPCPPSGLPDGANPSHRVCPPWFASCPPYILYVHARQAGLQSPEPRQGRIPVWRCIVCCALEKRSMISCCNCIVIVLEYRFGKGIIIPPPSLRSSSPCLRGTVGRDGSTSIATRSYCPPPDRRRG